MKLRRSILLLACLVLAAPLAAQDRNDAPPLVGRPADFSHIVGYYRLTVDVDMNKVVVETPITVTVRIAGQGPDKYLPQRRQLHLFPADFEQSFYLEPVPEKDRVLEEQSVWEFVYRLRPKSTQVQEIPPLRLVYYSPRGRRFQTSFSEAIPIEVTPPVVVDPKIAGLKRIQAPATFFEFREVGLDENVEVASYWSWPYLALLLLGPPLVGFSWLKWHRWRHPEIQRRTNQAARTATQTLEDKSLTHIPTRTLEVLGEYLRARLDFPGIQPTPAEVDRFLRCRGFARDVCRQWLEVFQACDASCYQPAEHPDSRQLAERGVQVIAALEADPVVQSSSKRFRFSAPAVRLMSISLLAPLLGMAWNRQNENHFDRGALAASMFKNGREHLDQPELAQGFFRRAAKLLFDLEATPNILFDRGNASFLAGDISQAILAFHQGLRLSPNDAAMRQNLEYVRGQVHYPGSCGRPSADSWPPWLLRPTVGFLYATTLGFLTLTCLALARWRCTRRPLSNAVWLTTFTLIGGGSWLYLEYTKAEEQRHAFIVIREETGFFRGNGPSYPRHDAVPNLNPGMEARRLFERGDWVQIQLPTGEIGWVPENTIVAGAEP